MTLVRTMVRKQISQPVSVFQDLRVNSDKVQNVGRGQNLDHLRTPLI